MKKKLCGLALCITLAGCASGTNPFRTMVKVKVKKPARPYLIQKINCSVDIPLGFTVTLSPIPEDDNPNGLIWRMEKAGTPFGVTTTVELMLDPNNEKNYSLENYMTSEVVTGLVQGDENIMLERTGLLVDGIPAQMVKIADEYEGPQGTYTVYVRVVALVKDGKIFKWVFTSNKMDRLQMKPIFDQFIQSIQFQ